MPWGVTVSYTHLDVYKRQELNSLESQKVELENQLMRLNENNQDSTIETEELKNKISSIDKEIEEKQNKLNIALENVNKLYEEYVSIMNEYSTGVQIIETE